MLEPPMRKLLPLLLAALCSTGFAQSNKTCFNMNDEAAMTGLYKKDGNDGYAFAQTTGTDHVSYLKTPIVIGKASKVSLSFYYAFWSGTNPATPAFVALVQSINGETKTIASAAIDTSTTSLGDLMALNPGADTMGRGADASRLASIEWDSVPAGEYRLGAFLVNGQDQEFRRIKIDDVCIEQVPHK